MSSDVDTIAASLRDGGQICCPVSLGDDDERIRRLHRGSGVATRRVGHLPRRRRPRHRRRRTRRSRRRTRFDRGAPRSVRLRQDLAAAFDRRVWRSRRRARSPSVAAPSAHTPTPVAQPSEPGCNPNSATSAWSSRTAHCSPISPFVRTSCSAYGRPARSTAEPRSPPGSPSCSNWSTSPTSATGCRAPCPAANSNGWPSLGPSHHNPRCSCSTNPSPHSIRPCVSRSAPRSHASFATSGSPRSSSRTTRMRHSSSAIASR